MRNIKYRGWSPDLKRFVYGAYYEHCSCAVCFTEEDKPEYHEPKIVFEEMTDWGFPCRTMAADVIRKSVGAFTGYVLNGKELYEGDIIEDKYIPGHGVIRFGEYGDAFHPEKTHLGFYVEWENKIDIRNDLGFWIDEEKVNVIGNLYQNPDVYERGEGLMGSFIASQLMTENEVKSCINTVNMLRRLALNIHGVIDVIDDRNINTIIKILEDEIPKNNYEASEEDSRR
jgi:hypothetical protein